MKQHKITNDNVEAGSNLKPTCFISINDTCGTPEVPYFNNHSNVKVMYFDDVEKDLEIKMVGTDKTQTVKAFTINQAKELLEFIDLNHDKEVFIVHCAAGISRSGAVGTFINDYFGGDYNTFKSNNPYILPNGQVLALLRSLIR